MKKTLIVGLYNVGDISGYLVVEVSDISPGEWINQREQNGMPQVAPVTINELWRYFGGPHGYLVHPIGNRRFWFDLSPWSHLEGWRYLQIDWLWQRAYPIPLAALHTAQ